MESRVSYPAILFLGMLVSLVSSIWYTSANGSWLPASDEESEISLRDVGSSSRRSVYNRYSSFGK